jgi:hypothetical protein
MQVEKLDGHIKASDLTWLNEVDVASLNPRSVQKFVQLCMLASAKFGDNEAIKFDLIYEQLGDKKLNLERREQILNEDPASKTANHVVDEVRAIIKKLIQVDKDQHEILNQRLSDDFLNLIEISCSISLQAVLSGDEEAGTKSDGDEVIGEVPPMLIGVTFLNKHCFVPDIYGDRNKDGKCEPLVKRSVELKFDFLRDVLGWQLLVIDETDFSRLQTKKDKEAFVANLLRQPEEPESDDA